MSRPKDTTSTQDPVLVRLLEQLTLYAAALDQADAPVLARLMRSTCDKLRSEHNTVLELRFIASTGLCISGSANCEHAPQRFWCPRCEHLRCWCFGSGDSPICDQCWFEHDAQHWAPDAEPFSSPSKPVALNTDPSTETSQARPARISTATPFQGRDEYPIDWDPSDFEEDKKLIKDLTELKAARDAIDFPEPDGDVCSVCGVAGCDFMLCKLEPSGSDEYDFAADDLAFDAAREQQ